LDHGNKDDSPTASTSRAVLGVARVDLDAPAIH